MMEKEKRIDVQQYTPYAFLLFYLMLSLEDQCFITKLNYKKIPELQFKMSMDIHKVVAK